MLYWRWDTVSSPADAESAQSRAQSRSTVDTTVKVITQPVFLSADDRVFEAVGTGRARLSVQVYPAVAEEITEVRFQAGEIVDKGQVLVQLDDREEKLAVRLAQVKLKNTLTLLERYKKALKNGAVPESEVDSAKADYDAAQVALDQAQLALEERKVRAAFQGVVGIPKVDPGDRVSTDTAITTLDDRAVLHVDFEVPEDLAGYFQSEDGTPQTITATTPAWPKHTFSGTVTALESRVNPQRRTIMARAGIENTDDLLRPGMSFITRWEIKGRGFPTVPEISLQWSRDGSFVWIIRDMKAERVLARVVARTGGNVLLDGPIAEGEPVVVEGLQRMQPGKEVTILGDGGDASQTARAEERTDGS